MNVPMQSAIDGVKMIRPFGASIGVTNLLVPVIVPEMSTVE